MKNFVLVLIKNHSDYDFFYRNKDLCNSLIKNFKQVKFLNISENIKNIPVRKYNNFFVNIEKFDKFKNYFKKNKRYVCISFIEKNINHFKYFRFLKKNSSLIIEIYKTGDLRDAKYFFNLNLINFFKKIFKIIFINVNFLIYAFSYYLNILPKTNILFHYNNNTKDQIGYSFTDSYKFTLLGIFKIIFVRKNIFLKKIRLINSINNNKLIKKEKIKNKYIVFLDSCFEHQDRFEYESRPKINDKIKYYQEINETFKDIKNFIFLLHPNSNLPIIKKYLKDVLVIKYKTQFFLQRSKLVLFHESSSILNAIYLRKKIISLDSDYLGRYFKYRSKLYANALNLKVINLSNKRAKSQIEKIVLNSLLRKDKKQKEYIFSNKTNRNGLDDIINEIKNLN